MTDFLESIGLHSEGFTDDQIAQIDAAKPKFAYLLNLAMQNRTVFNEVIVVANMIAAQIEQHQKETS